jgi:D-alanyl-lipoteichoic acid acyltransferase DltB (MBOAT superfamily)
MVFNSLTFILFFMAVLALHSLRLSWRVKKSNLLLASYIFYAAWDPVYVVLILITTAINFYASARMAEADSHRKRLAWLLLGLISSLGILAYFKYGGFFLSSFQDILKVAGVDFTAAAPDIVLPVGISFYTFQTLSYTLDVYRGKLKPTGSLLDFALFVTFFPQLVAGPIVRPQLFLPQLDQPKQANQAQMGWGLSLLLIGIFQKMILADYFLAPIADKVFRTELSLSALHAWTGALAFSGQIYFDFAGYSTCAIGIALCLGLALPDNFRSPYAAVGFRDFWRRWHISLSTWLRDYLYISLGGNRIGKSRMYLALMLTMLLGGLWHGAAWNFVIWGGLHGLLLLVERMLVSLFGHIEVFKKSVSRYLLGALTYIFVVIGWVFFRADTSTKAIDVVTAMFGAGRGDFEMVELKVIIVALMSIFLLGSHWYLRDQSLEQAVEKFPWWARGLVLAGIAISIILMPGGGRVFIYFQF